MNTKCWQNTFTGKKFFPLEPKIEDIDIMDIAHALGMICRFNGHSRQFYSVAEHSVHLSKAVRPQIALLALLHDAPEAYCSDIITPIKQAHKPLQDAEDRLWWAILERFGLNITEEVNDEIKAFDRRILITERDALLTPGPVWDGWDEVEANPLPVEIESWTPYTAKAKFLEQFKVLTENRNPIL